VIISDDLARIVDARGEGASATQRIVDPGVGAAAQEEAVDAGGGEVIPDDLTRGIDAVCDGRTAARRSMEGGGRGEEAAIRVVQEAVPPPAGVEVIPDDLARIVDAVGFGFIGGRGIVDSGVGATAFEEAVDAGAGPVLPDDLIRIIDAECEGRTAVGRRIVEVGVGVDWHDTGSSLIVSLAEGSIGKLSRYQTLARPELAFREQHQCSSHDVDRSGLLDTSTVAIISRPTANVSQCPRRAPIRHA